MKNDTQSSVVTLIAHVYKHTNEAKGLSWRLLNDALWKCLKVAIESQFRFKKDDFAELRPYGFSMWNACGGEGFYSQAVQCKNRSAAISFETWKDRKAFMLNGERLAIGSEFRLIEKPVTSKTKVKELLRVYVTSISAEKIGCCWYDNEYQMQQGNPKRRFSFTRDELKAAQKEGRAAMTRDDFEKRLKSKEKP